MRYTQKTFHVAPCGSDAARDEYDRIFRPRTSKGLQRALDTARPGDAIRPVRGRTYHGNFTVPPRTS